MIYGSDVRLGRIAAVFAVSCWFGLLLGGCPFQFPPEPQPQPTNQAPTFEFLQPTERKVLHIGDTLTLVWQDDDPDDDAVIRLFYDVDGIANTGDEVTIGFRSEDADGAGDQFDWVIVGVVAGSYRIGATIDDGVNSSVTVYLPYEIVILTDSPPEISLLSPTQDVTDPPTGQLTIRWSDYDAEEDATVRIFYDEDGIANSGDEKTIVETQEDLEGAGDSYTWDLTDVPAGTYFIGATIDDGVNDPVTVYASGMLILTGPSIDLLEPASDVTLKTGQTLKLRWDDTDHGHSAEVSLYYDLDLVPDNGNEVLIAQVAEDPDGEGDEYYWTLPDSLSEGNYYLLAKLDNGVDDPAYSYADGVLHVVAATHEEAVRDLNNAGTDFYAVIFDGYMPNARLGAVLAGGGDVNGDGYDDFVLVAPKARSPLINQNAGEAYLIYSVGADRWPSGTELSVATLGAVNFSGAIFIGPRYTGSSDGIQSVMFLPDMDGDGQAELLFGMPSVTGLMKEEQDYDPLDDDTTTYTVAPDWQPINSDSNPQSDDHDDWATFNTGLMVFVSSGSQLTNTVVLLDEVGQQTVMSHPSVVQGTGLRIYPYAGNDSTRWAEHFAVIDITGDRSDELFVSRPDDSGGLGSVRCIFLSSLSTWTSDLGSLGFTQAPETYSWPAADSNSTNTDRVIVWPMLWADIAGDSNDAPQGHLSRPAAIGDFDGDGFNDFAVAAPDAAPNGLAQAGIGYLVYGQSGFNGLDVGEIDDMTFPGFELESTTAGDRLGWQNVAPGDVNDDGRPEWVMSAPGMDYAGRSDCGAVVIVAGRQMYGSGTVDQVGVSLTGAIIYGANDDDQFGYWVATPGDVDGDKIPDLLIAAPGYDYGSRQDCGAVYLIYGGAHLTGAIDVRDIGTWKLPGKLYVGPEQNAGIGPISGAGDIDGDGRADFLIGYPDANARNMLRSGRVFLIYGSARAAP